MAKVQDMREEMMMQAQDKKVQIEDMWEDKMVQVQDMEENSAALATFCFRTSCLLSVMLPQYTDEEAYFRYFSYRGISVDN